MRWLAVGRTVPCARAPTVRDPILALPSDGTAASTGSDSDARSVKDVRTRQRQERNRLAAKKCREKKQREYHELEKEAELLRAENQGLKAQLTELTKAVQELKDLKRKA